MYWQTCMQSPRRDLHPEISGLVSRGLWLGWGVPLLRYLPTAWMHAVTSAAWLQALILACFVW